MIAAELIALREKHVQPSFGRHLASLDGLHPRLRAASAALHRQLGRQLDLRDPAESEAREFIRRTLELAAIVAGLTDRMTPPAVSFLSPCNLQLS